MLRTKFACWVSLDYNEIGVKGAKLLATGLELNTALRTLRYEAAYTFRRYILTGLCSLTGNMLRVEGLRAINIATTGSESLNAVKVDKRYLKKVGSQASMKLHYL